MPVFRNNADQQEYEDSELSNRGVQYSVVGLCGSLRKDSINMKLLRAAQSLAPGPINVTIFHLDDIPLYNQDVQDEHGFPAEVEELCQLIESAAAVLIVTPEYNYSIPGVLKNTIDWVSRWPTTPFDEKLVAILGASPGRLGTARCQYHLRQCFVFLNSQVINRPEVMLGNAYALFDESGNIIDEKTRELVAKLMRELYKKIESAAN
ncbi:NAD(P)H-dependent oxidoreductase [Photobacterium sagamiensis]|uniref:NADPH-dependent FMN reductase n=1 Tax=Photobacterium sagamiensis TaxID=2910241 RepID=UPI003D0F2376